MVGLSTHLSTIGISSAKGIDLVMQRDQINSTLPRSDGTSSQNTKSADTSKKQGVGKQELTAEQQRQVQELQQTDRNVRTHEQAHISAGRSVITSGPTYTYTYGPDGRQYATGGEVGIDTSPERKPQANIDKGQLIQAAALAPRDPSPQDYRVASVGDQLEAQGHSDLVRQQQEERIAQEEAAQQKREAQAAAARQAASSAHTAPAAGDLANGQSSGSSRLLAQNAYATVAAGSADAGRVSVFA